ncbi:MAG: ABC transporter ATP-binding protein [Oscillospiraceae bacterium]|nr:ABC transporter ATP-binding protein [Oscillospiraceae bacterium]
MESQMKSEQQKDARIAVSIKDVTKKFKLYNDRPITLKDRFLRGGKGMYEEFYALEHVSFDIYQGSTVGLIGQNGCGKSTLLKIINRTMFPNSGSVEIHGKVSSLIELGAGFHPDLSGRENIYTNATIFGLSKDEIERRVPDIIAFSELERFIDNPVRTYSSGMYARLAFSVAIHVDAEILLVDEILGVGDMNFQAKCANRIYQMRKSGMTIVLVTHDMNTIDRLCDYAVWLDHGKLIDKGNPKRIENEYLKFMAEEKEERERKEQKDSSSTTEETAELKSRITVNNLGDHFGNGDVLFTRIRLLDSRGVDKRSFNTGEKVTLQASYVCQTNPEKLRANFGFEINANQGVYIYGTNTLIEGCRRIPLSQEGVIEIVLDPLQLVEGDYSMGLAIVDAETQDPYDYYHNIVQFRVYSMIHDIGVSRIQHSFVVDGRILDTGKE